MENEGLSSIQNEGLQVAHEIQVFLVYLFIYFIIHEYRKCNNQHCPSITLLKIEYKFY